MKATNAILAVSLFSAFTIISGHAESKLNIADPETHPYVDPKGHREKFRFSEEKVNEFRVYDFYRRQAEYYLKQGKTEGIIPAFPGLDAGKHGHWGKYNQNSHKDGRWNDIIDDGLIGSHTVFPKDSLSKSIESGINLKLGKNRDQFATFSPREFDFIYFSWDDSLTYSPYRWGTSGGARFEGKTHFLVQANSTKDSSYQGYYKVGQEYIFSYTLQNIPLLNQIESKNEQFLNKIQFLGEGQSLEINLAVGKKITKQNGLFILDDQYTFSIQTQIENKIKSDNGVLSLVLNNIKKGDQVSVLISRTPMDQDTNHPSSVALIDKIKTFQATLNKEVYTTQGHLSNKNRAYVVDDIDLPFKNKTNSLMFFTGIDFNSQGDAFISTIKGDIWRVKGLRGDLKSVTWTKIASGLSQPFGIRFYKGGLYLAERTRIIRLNDLNGDGEIDYFENINNQLNPRPRSHSHKFGLEIDKQGNFYMVVDDFIQRVNAKTRQLETLGRGVRNCMGVGMLKDGSFVVGPQEGMKTPASSIFKVHQGDDYGFKSESTKLSPPMAYIPRGVDGSTGGFLQVNDDRWGPLGETFIGLSYGYGQWYQILIDSVGKRQQAATVPMLGEFSSGVVRAAINPVDGQVYVVGMDGWGDYSPRDGCLHRIRFTGKKLYQPIGYKTHFNGLEIRFNESLDSESVKNIKNYFAQHWDYVNSQSYGSPEYSVSQPDQLGHDILKIRSVQLLEDGKSIFVEIPKLQPVMQMHLYMNLKAKDGTSFKADLFPTIIELGDYYAFAGAEKQNINKPLLFNLRARFDKPNKSHTQTGVKDAHARKINILTKNMQYNLKTIKAKAGESLAIVLKNDDAMPHNLVIVEPGAHLKVGEAAFKMLNNPKAAELHYVPKMKEVVGYTNVIGPKATHTLYLKVPEKKGVYTFFCSFPGHYLLMKGDFIVE